MPGVEDQMPELLAEVYEPGVEMLRYDHGDGASPASGVDCVLEFGEHGDDHSDCARIIAEMSQGYLVDYDAYAGGWYDYEAGLHWSDFVDGPIGD